MMFRSTVHGMFSAVLMSAVLSLNLATSAAQELLHTFPAGSRLAFSADEKLFAGFDFTHATSAVDEWNAVAVWNVESGEMIARLPLGGRRVEAIAFVPGDKEALALLNYKLPGDTRRSIAVWDFRQNGQRHVQVIDVIDGEPRGPLHAFAISPDGTRAAVIWPDGNKWTAIRVLRLIDGSPIAELKVLGFSRQVIFGDNTTLTVLTAQHHRRKKKLAAYVHEWDIETREKRQTWGPFPMRGTLHRRRISWMSRTHLSPDGRTLATTLVDRIVVTEVKTGRYVTVGPPLAFNNGHANLRALAFDLNGYKLATGSNDAPAVWFWPIAGSSTAKRLHQPELNSVRTLEYSASGRLLAVGGVRVGEGPSHKVHVWRIRENSESDD